MNAVVSRRCNCPVKGGKYLEVLAKADVLLIDKTGTLTLGKPQITEIIADDQLGVRNQELGFAPDLRNYQVCQPMLQHLQISSVRLMSNNPRKVAALEEQGVTVVERIALHTDSNPHNEKYLQTKVGKLGHMGEGDS